MCAPLPGVCSGAPDQEPQRCVFFEAALWCVCAAEAPVWRTQCSCCCCGCCCCCWPPRWPPWCGASWTQRCRLWACRRGRSRRPPPRCCWWQPPTRRRAVGCEASWAAGVLNLRRQRCCGMLKLCHSHAARRTERQRSSNERGRGCRERKRKAAGRATSTDMKESLKRQQHCRRARFALTRCPPACPLLATSAGSEESRTISTSRKRAAAAATHRTANRAL